MELSAGYENYDWMVRKKSVSSIENVHFFRRFCWTMHDDEMIRCRQICMYVNTYLHSCFKNASIQNIMIL